MGVIYTITNLINNKIYVGSTKDFKGRKNLHLKKLYEQKANKKLQASWNKYGKENFEFKIIENIVDNSKLIEREQYWIDSLQPILNISPTAGSPRGVHHSLEARLNMSNAHKKLTKEQRNHKNDCKCTFCCNTKENHPRWIEREIRKCECGCNKEFECPKTSTRRFVNGHNNNRLGKKQPLEAVRIQSEKVSKPIKQYDLDGNFIRDWKSIKEAALYYKTHAGRIGECCKNKRKKYIKFIWKFKS